MQVFEMDIVNSFVNKTYSHLEIERYGGCKHLMLPMHNICFFHIIRFYILIKTMSFMYFNTFMNMEQNQSKKVISFTFMFHYIRKGKLI